METTLAVSVPWTRRWTLGKNRYDHVELAGAFGDLGTLIPFVVGYIAVMKIDPLGILFMFGASMMRRASTTRRLFPCSP